MRVPLQEMRARFELLCKVVPEFLSILPPDQYVKVSVARINTDAPYPSIRSKVEAYIKNAIATANARKNSSGASLHVMSNK
jgi:DNA modification methylase